MWHEPIGGERGLLARIELATQDGTDRSRSGPVLGAGPLKTGNSSRAGADHAVIDVGAPAARPSARRARRRRCRRQANRRSYSSKRTFVKMRSSFMAS